jgi:hypothetical protein
MHLAQERTAPQALHRERAGIVAKIQRQDGPQAGVTQHLIRGSIAEDQGADIGVRPADQGLAPIQRDEHEAHPAGGSGCPKSAKGALELSLLQADRWKAGRLFGWVKAYGFFLSSTGGRGLYG